MVKKLSAKAIARRQRNQRITAVYQSLPEGSWKLRHLAEMFDLSITTIFYILNGRNHKKPPHQ